MKKWFIVAVILLCGSGLARGASNLALSRASAKAGYNFDFEQLVIGADLNMGALAGGLYLVPQLEISIGGDYSVFSIDGPSNTIFQQREQSALTREAAWDSGA